VGPPGSKGKLGISWGLSLSLVRCRFGQGVSDSLMMKLSAQPIPTVTMTVILILLPPLITTIIRIKIALVVMIITILFLERMSIIWKT